MTGYDQLPRVAHVLNEFEVVINKGQADGITLGITFLIFGQGPEIRDPVTRQSLGALEVLRGRGKVVHIQERLATVRSSATEPIYDSTPNVLAHFGPRQPVRFEDKPFRGAEVGDLARPV
jgi:hypothetical protein